MLIVEDIVVLGASAYGSASPGRNGCYGRPVLLTVQGGDQPKLRTHDDNQVTSCLLQRTSLRPHRGPRLKRFDFARFGVRSYPLLLCGFAVISNWRGRRRSTAGVCPM